MNDILFLDREEAGRLLAQKLLNYKNNQQTLVLALPRGGVVVGAQIAKILNLSLDVIITRKIGAPYNPEFAIAAVGKKSIFYNPSYKIDPKDEYFIQAIKKERQEIIRREKLYRRRARPQNYVDKTVIITDDGLATGLTMQAAIPEIKALKAKEIILAVPVAPLDIISKFQKVVDKIEILFTPSDFWAIGQFYQYFPQTTDQEVINLLDANKF